MRLFYDFSPGGSVCRIFASIFRYKVDQNWLENEFDLMDDTSQFKMAEIVFGNLIDLKCFRLPVVYIRPEIDENLHKEITEILKNRGCETTTEEDDATHIIFPRMDALPDDYARPSFRQENSVMIHWYYFPESYDSWLPNTFDLPVSSI